METIAELIATTLTEKRLNLNYNSYYACFFRVGMISTSTISL